MSVRTLCCRFDRGVRAIDPRGDWVYGRRTTGGLILCLLWRESRGADIAPISTTPVLTAAIDKSGRVLQPWAYISDYKNPKWLASYEVVM